jgi:hypothetical protein
VNGPRAVRAPSKMMYSTRRRDEMESPGCSTIGAVAGFAPRVRIAPVGVPVGRTTGEELVAADCVGMDAVSSKAVRFVAGGGEATERRSGIGAGSNRFERTWYRERTASTKHPLE